MISVSLKAEGKMKKSMNERLLFVLETIFQSSVVFQQDATWSHYLFIPQRPMRFCCFTKQHLQAAGVIPVQLWLRLGILHRDQCIPEMVWMVTCAFLFKNIYCVCQWEER